MSPRVGRGASFVANVPSVIRPRHRFFRSPAQLRPMFLSLALHPALLQPLGNLLLAQQQSTNHIAFIRERSMQRSREGTHPHSEALSSIAAAASCGISSIGAINSSLARPRVLPLGAHHATPKRHAVLPQISGGEGAV
ncbi:hypothetical protein PYCCODRAFT_671491 [Trametes coccinea BRFM310]|uniref:Uncharacterized protein n=1 Tax=Trametes coccinea (strain BRFM310) TaxID=1353009 RepID=A0A1Y2IHE0_TRAC3|nr:hypothetical protein PYCCODRAFT_671491 [Trametes coccinea BRFM310]